jgi:hypothetical protein
VLTALLMMSWSAVQLDRVEEDAAARHRRPPVVVQLVADPSGQRVVPGCGTPQPGTAAGRGGLERGNEPDAGGSVSTTDRPSGSCVLVWVP